MTTRNIHYGFALLIALAAILQAHTSSAADTRVNVHDIRIRDPFIYAERASHTYFMYASAANRAGSGYQGVEVYTSHDLQQWQTPVPVMKIPRTEDVQAVWAPEMHRFKDKYYLFVTLTRRQKLPNPKPVDNANWPAMFVRGTYIFRADNPRGPFFALKHAAHTPADWMALDGTLYVENDQPYMVFCHEWVQTIDGTMDAVALRGDLSDTIGQPRLLFRASIAPGSRQGPKEGKVTDGCFLYRSPSGKRLFMIWSTFLRDSGYCVMVTHSESGTIAGPWRDHRPLYTRDGGHGMLFRTFDDRLLLALHQPNGGGRERLHLFRVEDDGESLRVVTELNLR